MVRPAHNQRSSPQAGAPLGGSPSAAGNKAGSEPQGVPAGRSGREGRPAKLRTADFRKVYAEGRRRNLGILVAFARASGEQASRVGLTVPRSLGGAVERNRLKRRLREAVRRHRAELVPGWDIVFQPRAEAKTALFADLEERVRNFFRACADVKAEKPPIPNS